MKIAVTYDNGTVYQHFGHTKQFKIYTVEDNKVVSSETVDTGDSGHGTLAGFFSRPGRFHCNLRKHGRRRSKRAD